MSQRSHEQPQLEVASLSHELRLFRFLGRCLALALVGLDLPPHGFLLEQFDKLLMIIPWSPFLTERRSVSEWSRVASSLKALPRNCGPGP